MSEPTFAEVLAELRALRNEVAELRPLRVEVESLRRQVVDAVPTPGHPVSPSVVCGAVQPPVAPGPAAGVRGGVVDRRGALRTGLLAAGAAAAVVAFDAAPAAAANSDPLVLGSITNAATAGTILAVNAATNTVGIGVWDVSRAALAPNVFPAISGYAKGTSFNVGVEGFATGTGTGVQGQTVIGAGVNGLATGANGLGVQGQGQGAGGVGVAGVGASSGVTGNSSEGLGMSGVSQSGTGVFGQASSGVGVYAYGGIAHLRLGVQGSRPAPTGDSTPHQTGDVVLDQPGNLWLCTAGGTPGTWTELGGPTGAGSLHVLPAPARVYDSRPGTLPAVGSKTPLAANVARTLDCKVNSSSVPADATAVMCTMLLVNAANGNGNITIWANGVAKPLANTMVWGGSSGRFSSLALTSCGANANVQVSASAQTDLVLDIVGYYR